MQDFNKKMKDVIIFLIKFKVLSVKEKLNDSDITIISNKLLLSQKNFTRILLFLNKYNSIKYMTQINFILFLFNSSYGHKKTEDNVYFSIFK